MFGGDESRMMNDSPNVGPGNHLGDAVLGYSVDDRLSGAESTKIEEHMLVCEECRERREAVRAIGVELRRLPVEAFPEETLRELFAKTVDAVPPSRLPSRSPWPIKTVARAAAIFLAFSVSWISWNQYGVARRSEVSRSAIQVRYIVGTTARALHRVEQAAVADVLIRGLAEPLHRISSQWLERIPLTKGSSGI